MSLFKQSILDRIAEVYTLAKTVESTDLGPDGYKIAITALLGFTPTNWETDEVFKHRNNLTQEDLREILKYKLNHVYIEQYVCDMFTNFDKDFKGSISLYDVRKAWKDASSKIPWGKVEESFRELSNNGLMDYTTFHDTIVNENNRTVVSKWKHTY